MPLTEAYSNSEQTMNLDVDVSIVIIARNEAENIARTIEAVLNATKHWSQVEIILVDSASTDDTVQIASQYPTINIVRLRPEWFLCAAAGRHIGTHYTRGDLILFLDGDMDLIEGWLDEAVPYMISHPNVAGVAGYRRDIYVRNGQIIEERDFGRISKGRPIKVKYFGGAALYRRAAFEKTGGFNPFIISDEEPELCMRLRYAGYELVRIPSLMCKNYTLPLKTWDYFVRRFRTGLWLGHGQVPRYHLGTDLFWMAIAERGTYVFYIAGMLITFIVLLITLFLRTIKLLIGWGLVVILFLLFYWIKKRSFQAMLMSVIHQSFATYGALRGFFMPPKPPEEYPTDAEVVQIGYHRGGVG